MFLSGFSSFELISRMPKNLKKKLRKGKFEQNGNEIAYGIYTRVIKLGGMYKCNLFSGAKTKHLWANGSFPAKKK